MYPSSTGEGLSLGASAVGEDQNPGRVTQALATDGEAVLKLLLSALKEDPSAWSCEEEESKADAAVAGFGKGFLSG